MPNAPVEYVTNTTFFDWGFVVIITKAPLKRTAFICQQSYCLNFLPFYVAAKPRQLRLVTPVLSIAAGNTTQQMSSWHIF